MRDFIRGNVEQRRTFRFLPVDYNAKKLGKVSGRPSAQSQAKYTAEAYNSFSSWSKERNKWVADAERDV